MPDASRGADPLPERTAHPHREETVRLGRILLAASPHIVDGVKRNAPSYRTAE
jgi:hypothetical protein